ncbi:hypothetical protein DBR39_20530 [Chryseobacterium sp. KBW03]|nr:hypothetical protein DBR39_20530 [Chryseobacterium sp. KBW03]
MIFFAYNMFNIFLRGYGLKEEYNTFKILIYVLYFLILPLLTATFICIFRESRKMFFYLNISLFLMLIFHAVIFNGKYQKIENPTNKYLLSYIFLNIIFVVGPVVLINYFKHHPAGDEIESIGKHKD